MATWIRRGVRFTLDVRVEAGKLDEFSTSGFNRYAAARDETFIVRIWRIRPAKPDDPDQRRALRLYLDSQEGTYLENAIGVVEQYAESAIPGLRGIEVKRVGALGEWPGAPVNWWSDPEAFIANGLAISFFYGIAAYLIPGLRPWKWFPRVRVVLEKAGDRRRASDKFTGAEIEKWLADNPGRAENIIARVFGSGPRPSRPVTPVRHVQTTFSAPAVTTPAPAPAPVRKKGDWATDVGGTFPKASEVFNDPW